MEKTKSILALFFENEKRVLELYKEYAKKIAGHKLFWRGIAKDEEAHVAALAKLNLRYKNGSDLFKANSHILDIFDYVGGFIGNEIIRAKSENVSQGDALETALRVEQSMVERKCFEMVRPEKTEIMKIFKRLNTETEEHIRLLLKEYKRSCK